MELSPETLEVFFDTVQPHLDERQRRVVAGAMAEALGRGGQVRVATASKMSTNTLWRAVTEVREGIEVSDRVRRPGGGDKPAIERQPELLSALDDLVHPDTRGNPMSLLRWTSKSTYELARELTREGYSASAELVRRLLHQMGYSLQAPAKEKEGTNHPDRDAQFSYLNDQASSFMADDQPVVSVDTKKKELVGEYANKGREWQPTGLETTVCHYPPGTSKWNKIEHRMFSFISMNWRGRALVSYRTIVELIAATTTEAGLRIEAEHDTTGYRTKVKISDAELEAVPLRRHEFHGDWNYTVASA